MSDEAKVRALLGPLLERPIDVTGAEPPVDRERIAQAILRAGREGGVATRASGQLGWLLAAAAGVLLVGGAAALWQTRQPGLASSKPEQAAPSVRAEPAFVVGKIRGSVTRSEGETTQALKASAQASRLSAAGELWTGPSSGADLWHDDGLRIELSENTRVTLSGLRAGLSHKSLELLAGQIRYRSTELGVTGGFSIITPDAVVLVRAALLSVDVKPQASGGRSCVRVETGQVEIQSAGGKQLLQSGGTWGCDAGELGEPPLQNPASLAPELEPPKSRNATTTPLTPSGTLDDENRLFQAGLSSERSGDRQAAATSFRALLTRYPKSPLAADARRALERVTRTPSAP
jgi:hypothetical protein